MLFYHHLLEEIVRLVVLIVSTLKRARIIPMSTVYRGRRDLIQATRSGSDSASVGIGHSSFS